MSENIYVIQRIFQPETCKIGSTKNFIIRMASYITPEPEFDNMSHNIWNFTITSSKWNCYQIDKIIQYASRTHSMPYVKHDSTGGTEHYKFTHIDDLQNFFDKFDIKYVMEKINVDELRSEISKLNMDDCDELDIIDKKEIRHILLDEEITKNIDKIFNTKFILKDYQNDMRKLIANRTERLFHLIVSPTGTGKTVVFSIVAFDEILKSKKDIMIVIKRKDVLSQLIDRIKNYLEIFNKDKIITLSENHVNIVSCIDDCTIEKLNKKEENKSQIYLVNFDKFTSSEKNKKYSDIKFDKFGMIIVDESHWCGAQKIYNFMKYVKNETTVDVVGFSATPLRCSTSHRERTEELFSDKDKNLNVLFEYSYYDALKNLDICPIQWMPISMDPDDFEDVKDNENDDCSDDIYKDKKDYKVLNEDSYEKVWNVISKIESFRKKGILWFRQRTDMLSFYNNMKDKLKEYTIYCTMSYESNDKIFDLVEKSGLDNDHFKNAIHNFGKQTEKSLLFAVNRATEGFDDDIIDFCARMYYSTSVDPVTETQRMGRLNRWYKNDPTQKKIGHFATLEISNVDELKKSILARLKSWITFARSYDKSGESGRKIDDIKKEIEEIITRYVSADILNTYKIDIKKEIVDAFFKREKDITVIRRELIKENKKRASEKRELIKTKVLYDEWAKERNYPICDELEELDNKISFGWLFDIKNNEYLAWDELVKLCREVRYTKYKNIKNFACIYQEMIKDGYNIPKEPEVFYKGKFTTYTELFC